MARAMAKDVPSPSFSLKAGISIAAFSAFFLCLSIWCPRVGAQGAGKLLEEGPAPSSSSSGAGKLLEEGPAPSSSSSGTRLKSAPLLVSADGRFHAFAAIDSEDGAQRVWILAGSSGARLRWEEVIDLWQHDTEFAGFYSQVLALSPFQGFFWECPPITAATVAAGAEFEHVTVENAWGFAEASPVAFEQHFRGCSGQDDAITFKNLGGDSTLVSPCEPSPSHGGGGGRSFDAYGHLASFVRRGEAAPRARLWATVGSALAATLQERGARRATWLSTEGSGVPWVHVRMDSWPKYYHHESYKEAPR